MDVKFIVSRLREIEEQLVALKQEKSALRDQLKWYLKEHHLSKSQYKLSDETIYLTLSSRVSVKYDEAKLKSNLRDQYSIILRPDIKKIKDHLSLLQPVLSPFIEQIGTPSRELVEEKILSGELMVSDFKGTFEKSISEVLVVRVKKARRVDKTTP